MLKEFREFAMRGNVVDLAVGVVIGGAFGAIVNSFVKDIIMPPIGMALGNVDFNNLFKVLKEGATPGPYATPDAAAKAGAVTLNYGMFINTIITFIIIAFAVFIVIRAMNKMKKPVEAAPDPGPTKEESLLGEIRDILKAQK